MGRYAEFNSGFLYKFAFGVQASADIEQFGGRCVYNDYCTGVMEWSLEDLDEINAMLMMLEKEHSYCRPDLSTYDKTMEGTHKLCDDIKYARKQEDPVYYRYVLGIMILHQLSYQKNLRAEYEN